MTKSDFEMQLKECLTEKKKVAWVDFYDLTTQNEEVWEFSKQEEGLVQWDNMIGTLKILFFKTCCVCHSKIQLLDSHP